MDKPVEFCQKCGHPMHFGGSQELDLFNPVCENCPVCEKIKNEAERRWEINDGSAT